jgi:hypothetical protein
MECAVLLFQLGNIKHMGWNETVLSVSQMTDAY